MHVRIETEPNFSAGTPTPLITGPYGVDYNIGPDGRLLMTRASTLGQIAGQTSLAIVENWFEELERLAPTSE
jgi:hypothetical protein